MQFPSLPPLIRRPEDQEDLDKPIWQPSWNCFCCHDTGFVYANLISKIIPDYDCSKHKIPVCQRRDCRKGKVFLANETIAPSLDTRFTPDICSQLDQFSRQQWQSWAKQKQKIILSRRDLDKLTHNLRTRSRTPEEEIEARMRHEEAIDQCNSDTQVTMNPDEMDVE